MENETFKTEYIRVAAKKNYFSQDIWILVIKILGIQQYQPNYLINLFRNYPKLLWILSILTFLQSEWLCFLFILIRFLIAYAAIPTWMWYFTNHQSISIVLSSVTDFMCYTVTLEMLHFAYLYDKQYSGTKTKNLCQPFNGEKQ